MDKLVAAFFLLLILCADCTETAAQDASTRFGLGAGVVINPSNREVSDDDLGVDLRGRISLPVSEAVSVAADIGTFIFSHNDRTEFVLNPQVSLIVTLGGTRRFPYFMAGAGAVLPAEQDKESQLEVHVGYGWAWPFGTRMSAFVEIDPLVAFRQEGIAVMVPVRGGFIF